MSIQRSKVHEDKENPLIPHFTLKKNSFTEEHNCKRTILGHPSEKISEIKLQDEDSLGSKLMLRKREIQAKR